MLNMQKFAVKSIKIPSSWFDAEGKSKSIYEKIGGYRGLNIYLQLYKFRVNNQGSEHTFYTSIQMLREQTKVINKRGYSSEEILDILKLLKRNKIIELKNYSRWDQLVDDNGEVLDKMLLHIKGLNYLPLCRWSEKERQLQSIAEDDKRKYYIYVPLDVFEAMIGLGLDERHFTLLLLIIKLKRRSSKFNRLETLEEYCFMSILEMSKRLCMSDKTVQKLIKELNEKTFLVTKKKMINGKITNINYPLVDLKLNTMQEFEQLHEKHIAEVEKIGGRLSFIYGQQMDTKSRHNKQKEVKQTDKQNELLITLQSMLGKIDALL